jgi:hypothetical protein
MHHLPCVSLHFVAFLCTLFSAVFVFQKSYTGNILEIGRNKFQKSYFSWKSTKDRTRAEGGLPTQQGGVAQPLAAPTYCVTTLVAS